MNPVFFSTFCEQERWPGMRSTLGDEHCKNHTWCIEFKTRKRFCAGLSLFKKISAEKNRWNLKKVSVSCLDYTFSFVIRSRPWAARGARRQILFLGVSSLCFLALCGYHIQCCPKNVWENKSVWGWERESFVCVNKTKPCWIVVCLLFPRCIWKTRVLVPGVYPETVGSIVGLLYILDWVLTWITNLFGCAPKRELRESLDLNTVAQTARVETRESRRWRMSAFGFEKNASSIYVEHSCRLERSP